jgi:hypothetical protein
MDNLNGQEYTVTVKDAYSFEINTDTTSYPEYYRGGYCKLLKRPEILNFDSMNKSYENPGEFVCDFMKFAHAPILHLAFKALDKYMEEKGSSPNPGSSDDAQAFFDYVKSVNSAAPGDGKHFKLEEGDINEYECRSIFQDMRTLQGKLLVQNKIPFDLPKRLWHFLLGEAGIAFNTKWADLKSANQQVLIQSLTRYTLDIKGKTTFKEEFVTCGGVDLKDIDAQTMESKLVPGLHFAGEMMDVDGITGGFNFQHAWSSGWAVAKAIVAK